MGYAILHLEKASGNDAGMSAHIERTVKPKNADETQTHLNRKLIDFPEGVVTRTQAIQYRLDQADLKRKIGKNQVRAIRILLSGSPEDMKRIQHEGRLDEWCKDNLDYLKKTYGEANLVSAVLHMDEKTPHIHATVVPIVTGERRKAKSQKETDPDKKQYRKKNTSLNRLCADDVMSRTKLKEYQNTYAEAMTKYGLQRGIEGSEARHIGTQQYYRDLSLENQNIQEDIQRLMREKEEKEKALRQVKNEVIKVGFEKTVKDTGKDILTGMGRLIGNPRVKELESENSTLKQQVSSLDGRLRGSQAELVVQSEKYQEKQNTLDKLFDYFPMLKEQLRIVDLCRYIGFTLVLTKELLTGKSLKFSGEVKSPDHNQRFATQHSVAKIFKDEQSKLHLTIDDMKLKDWCIIKYSEFLESRGIKINERNQNRSVRK